MGILKIYNVARSKNQTEEKRKTESFVFVNGKKEKKKNYNSARSQVQRRRALSDPGLTPGCRAERRRNNQGGTKYAVK